MTIPTEDEVLMYQSHYIDRLDNPDSDELMYILYNYGPCLLMHTDITKLRVSYTANSIYMFLIDAVFVLFCGNGGISIREAKTRISNIMTNRPNTNEYTPKIKELCDKALVDLRNYQYTSKLLESAILNFSPITEYQGVVVKPGMETHEPIKTDATQDPNLFINTMVSILRGTKEEMILRLNSILVSNLQSILSNNTDFVHIDNYDGQYKMVDKETGIPSDVLYKLAKVDRLNCSDISAMVYYILAHFIFGYDIDTIHVFSDKLEKLGLSVNGIMTGKRVDVSAVMESLSVLTLPSIKNTMYSINDD